MLKFDKTIAEAHLNKMLKQYNIKVVKWSVSSCGRAYPSFKQVKIPEPIDVGRFCVAMHEIKHVIDGIWGKLYQREFACEMFAIEQAESLGFDATMYKERARRYVIMNIAKGHARKLDLSKIEHNISEFCNIDFSKWKHKKVFVTGWGSAAVYQGRPLNIELNEKGEIS